MHFSRSKWNITSMLSNAQKSASAVCEFFIKGECLKENLCPFRHSHGEKSVVCKHWLRGLCKRGDQCEFLHEYDMTKMPRCYFYTKYGECSKKECSFLHIDVKVKTQDCPWYEQGFCKNGPLCKNKHTRKVICVNYLAGFCPEGTECKFSHPNNEFTEWNMESKEMDMLYQYPSISNWKTKLHQGYKALDKVMCFKCREKGHYANKCSKQNQDNRH
ncbi:cleavage and polyadenylation specificity factor subunit 4-like [Hemitrygon akajei]|uniref:cleavage and polyadenylation specificity factor subunit 4-like n=1 Tax=Hemitrygon akajei TaxID=2704970 RepID=UPI003BF95214